MPTIKKILLEISLLLCLHIEAVHHFSLAGVKFTAFDNFQIDDLIMQRHLKQLKLSWL